MTSRRLLLGDPGQLPPISGGGFFTEQEPDILLTEIHRQARDNPIIDLALIVSIVNTVIDVQQHGWAQTQSDVLRMGSYWLLFVAIDLLAGWIAYRLEPTRQRFPAFLMIMQRFVYRQLMYGVVIRSIHSALRGQVVGWGKLARTGSVSSATQG